MKPPLSQDERNAYWQKLARTFPGVPAKLAFEVGTARGPTMRHGTSILSCQFSLNGDDVLAAGGGRMPGCDTAIRMFARANGDESLVCRGHIFGIYDLAIQPGTGFVASASEDYSVVLWNLEKRDAIFVVGGDPIVKGHVAFATEKNWLAVGEQEAYEDLANSAFIIDLDTGRDVFRQKLTDSKEVSGLAITEDGARLFVAVANYQHSPQGTELFCWDIGRAENWFVSMLRNLFTRNGAFGGKSAWKKSFPEFNITELRILPGQPRLIAAVSEHGEEYRAGVCLLNAQTGDVLAKSVRPDISASIAVSPEGRWIAVAYGEGGIELLQASDLAPIKTIAEGKDGRFTSLQFSPDGNMLLAGASVHVPDQGAQGELRWFAIS